MHGPQALASTVAPTLSSSSMSPSRSMVARTVSEPGVTRSGEAAVAPWALAWRATLTVLQMSS